MTLRQKIDEIKAAYKVLKMFVDDDMYLAYLQGLLDAYELEINKRFEDQS